MGTGKRGRRKVRPLPWLQARSEAVFDSKYCDTLVNIARERKFPNGAYESARDEVFLDTGDLALAEELATSCRFLAMIRRDHGEEAFDMVIRSLSTTHQVPRSKSTGTKGQTEMSTNKPAEQQEVRQTNTMPTLPLKHIVYRASVNGASALVRCIQQFRNDAQHPVEAVYCFPMPDDASVVGCTMVIGARTVKAELKEKQKARVAYQQAIEEGHYGALLEQERPNIFTMSVGGIEPGEEIEVKVDYMQRMPWQAGGGRFTIPLVVAPRFIAGVPVAGANKGGGWSPDTDQVPDASRITPQVAREGVSYDANIHIVFTPGFDCDLTSPSHSAFIEEQWVGRMDTVELETSNIVTDRDFVLVYASQSHQPEVALHTGQYGEENFVQVTILPPGTAPVVASDVLLVLDCSGSMSGAKIEGLKRIAKEVCHRLRHQEVGHRVGIVPFDHKPWPSYPISDVSEATGQFIDQLRASGGTELGYALTAAHTQFQDASRPHVILLVTDGETESLNYTGSGVRIVAVGIDTAVNDTAIKHLASKTGGTYEFVHPGEDYSALANRMVGYLSGPVLRDVKVSAEEGNVVGVSDVFQGRPAVITVRFMYIATPMTISGITPAGKRQEWTLDPHNAKESQFVAQVWARDFIREHADAKEQTQVSLKYGVICNHTSFVAIAEKEVPGQKPERVEIPVNLPSGWDYEAVFGAAGAKGSVLRSLRLSPAGGKHQLSARGVLRAAVDNNDDDMVLGACLGGDLGTVDSMLVELGEVEANIVEVDDVKVTPVLPPIPPAGASRHYRFNLDSANAVDRLIAVLVTAQSDYDAAAAAFKLVEQELTADKVAELSQVERAMAYYFAARLIAYRLRLNKDVMKALRVKPSDRFALKWFELACKEEGKKYYTSAGDVTGDGDAYIAWKFGQGPKPTSGGWSVVP